MQKPIDTLYLVETPEAIDLHAQLAGPVPRMLAYSIDLLIRFGLISVLFIILAFAGKAGWGLFLICNFVLEWLYPVFFEVVRGGQTPGKRKMNLVVVNDDLTPIRLGGSFVRNLLRVADFLPFAYIFGLVAMCFSYQFQRFGDIAAGTVVIHQQEVKKNKLELPDVQSKAPPVSLSIEDEIALTAFVQRSQQLSASRKQELANLLEGITQKTDQEGVEHIQGIGNWLLGKIK